MVALVRLSLIAWCVLLGSDAMAGSVTVPPGPGTPVQDAIDAASPGDTIRLTLGAYPENLVIDKAITLRGVRSTSTDPNGTTVVTGTCSGGPRIVVAADGARVRGIQVVAPTGGGVQVVGRQSVRLTDVFVGSHCPGTTGPAFDIAQSTRVSMRKLWASGQNNNLIPQPGIRIADTPQAGHINLKNSISAGFVVGVLLENDGILSVHVSTGYYNFNDRGVLLQSTSRAVIEHNSQVIDNVTSGIEIDANSSGNQIIRNTISGSVNDVVDNGAGNCWRNNTYTTGSVPPC